MGNGATAPLRVLLVEDNATHAHLIQRHLKKAAPDSLILEHVERMADALARLEQHAADAVLLDLSLPDSEIHETLPKFIVAHSEVPILVLTSMDDLEFATRAVAQGAQDFLVKSDLNGPLLVRSINYAIERKKTQERLESYAAELESSNEQLKGFAHALAHEVKSPLTVVSACLQVLEQNYRGAFSQEHWEYVEDAGTAILSLTTMVNDLLEFSKMGSDRPTFAPVDVEAVFYQAYVCLRPAIRDSQAVITHDPLPTVMGNEVQLRQLLVNLIGNAIKYSEGEPEVHLSSEEQQTHQAFSVRDKGPGIASEDQDRIFDAFVRLSGAGQVQGSGIGLALCKRIVENHGGRIWVESGPGLGSTFHFTLPK